MKSSNDGPSCRVAEKAGFEELEADAAVANERVCTRTGVRRRCFSCRAFRDMMTKVAVTVDPKRDPNIGPRQIFFLPSSRRSVSVELGQHYERSIQKRRGYLNENYES